MHTAAAQHHGNDRHRPPRTREFKGRFGAENFLERFWAKIDVRGPDECWEWTATRHYKGYGEFRIVTSRSAKAHGVAWILANTRDIPAGMVVCHRCDNPPCCNPGHLFLGTVGDNNRDRAAKGRGGKTRAWKLFCKHGHRRTAENVYFRKGGWLQCRECTLNPTSR